VSKLVSVRFGRRKRMSLSEEEARGLDDLERWQIEEIKKGLEEADRGSLPATRKSSRR